MMRVWAAPIVITVVSVVALVVGLVADGPVDVAAALGVSIPVFVIAWRVIATLRYRARTRAER